MNIKLYRGIISLIIMSITATSCSKTDLPFDGFENYSIKAETYPKDNKTLSIGGDNYRYILELPANWVLEPFESEWCIITQTKAEEITKLDIFIKRNKSGYPRTASFTLTAPNGYQYTTYTIKQHILGSDAKGFLEVRNNSAGELSEQLKKLAPYMSGIEKLRISGPVNTTDCEVMKSLQSLVELDMENADITKFPDGQFTDFSFIETLTLPRKLNSIGKAFYDGSHSSSINHILVPDDSELEIIDDYAFYNCSFRTFDVSDNIRHIGKYAFYNCSSWSGSVQIPEAMTEIGDCTFYNCRGVNFDKIPDCIIKIGKGAFRGCRLYGQQSMDLPNSLKEIGESAFAKAYIGFNALPESVEAISDSAFFAAEIMALSIGGHVKSIGASAFEDSRLTSLELGNGVKTLGKRAFAQCQLRTDLHGSNIISIPGSIEQIGDECFVAGEYYKASFVLDINEGVKRIGRKAFANTAISLKDNQLPSSLEEIGDGAFSNCTSIKGAVSLPYSTRRIGDKAFYQCSGITSLDMSHAEDLGYIGDSAFDGCNKITLSCVIKGKNVNIGELAFRNCGFDAINLAEGVVRIGTGAFESCTKAITLTLPSSLEHIGHKAFSGCSAIAQDLILHDNLKFLGHAAFKNCSSLTSLTIPKGITEIREEAFSGCSALRGDIIIPDNITSIGNSAFKSCGFDGTITLSNNLTYIGSSAFYSCKLIKGMLRIPANVEELGSLAFSGCHAITALAIEPGKLTVISNNAFSGCVEVKGNIYIPDNIEVVQSSAFYNCSSRDGSTVIILGVNVRQIDDKAFDSTYSKTVICHNEVPPNIATQTFGWYGLESIDLFVPLASIQMYYNHAIWKKSRSVSAIN